MATVVVWLRPVVADVSTCDPAEQRRAERFSSSAAGLRWLGSRAVVRQLLAGATGQPAGTLRFAEDADGKPRLVDHPDVHFNVSHSRHLVAVAIADRPVGVDIEVDRHLLRPAGVARRLGMPPDRDEAAIVRAWVRTEALLKATGTGARAGLAGAEARLRPQGWLVRDLETDPGIVAAVAARGSDWVVADGSSTRPPI